MGPQDREGPGVESADGGRGALRHQPRQGRERLVRRVSAWQDRQVRSEDGEVHRVLSPDAADDDPPAGRRLRRRGLVYAALVIEGRSRGALPGRGEDDDVRRALLSLRRVGRHPGLLVTGGGGIVAATREPGAPPAPRLAARTTPRSPGTRPRRSPA